MSKDEEHNWQLIKEALEKENKTDSFFYKRAIALLAGKEDPINLD